MDNSPPPWNAPAYLSRGVIAEKTPVLVILRTSSNRSKAESTSSAARFEKWILLHASRGPYTTPLVRVYEGCAGA
jgi:hypothetical protein